MSEDLVDFLSRPEAWPEGTESVEVRETHLSRVFLTDRHAFKMKKPVRFDYLDFSTLDHRRRCCEEEVHLNRRLAAEVYLGTRAVFRAPGGGFTLVDPGGKPFEWLVWMKRLPPDLFLDALLRGGGPDPSDVDRAARMLARFYAAQPPLAVDPEEFLGHLRRDLEEDHREMQVERLPGDGDRLARLARDQLRRLEDLAGVLKGRARGGRVLEVHGDLRPEHICLQDPPVFIDCLEFNPHFRRQDPLEELAFLALECEREGGAPVGARFLEVYEEITGDEASPGLVEFYKSRRAVLWLKLSLWHERDRREQAVDYLERAEAALEPAAAAAARPGASRRGPPGSRPR